MYGYHHQWGNWGDPYAISFASLFGPQKPKPDCGATVRRSHDGHYVFRVAGGVENYLHKDGTWHKQCGLQNFYASEREATVAADLAERFDVVVHTLPWQSPCDATLDAHEAAGIMGEPDAALGLVVDLLCRLGYPRTAKALGEAGK